MRTRLLHLPGGCRHLDFIRVFPPAVDETDQDVTVATMGDGFAKVLGEQRRLWPRYVQGSCGSSDLTVRWRRRPALRLGLGGFGDERPIMAGIGISVALSRHHGRSTGSRDKG